MKPDLQGKVLYWALKFYFHRVSFFLLVGQESECYLQTHPGRRLIMNLSNDGTQLRMVSNPFLFAL